MAGIEADEFTALIRLLRGASEEAGVAAENAAAIVLQRAAQAAAPRRTGQLAASIKIIESKDRKALAIRAGASPRLRLFVGPEKKKGYYGYFVEKGHRSPKGKAIMIAGKPSRRIKRSGSGLAHSQSGLTTFTDIPAHPWFRPAIEAAIPQAEQAAEAAFDAKLEELDAKG